jgi:septal ring factor EnvC (AmiA/AmiB activator)
MPERELNAAELEDRIATIRENIRQLIEQATGSSGAADEDRISQRIAEQEEKLELLTKQREELLHGRPTPSIGR